MKTEFFVRYGCYLGDTASKLILEHPADATPEQLEYFVISELYELAREETEGWVGSHGFEIDEEDEDEEFREEAERMLVEEALEYTCVAWDEETYAHECTYGHDTGPNTMEWEYATPNV